MSKPNIHQASLGFIAVIQPVFEKLFVWQNMTTDNIGSPRYISGFASLNGTLNLICSVVLHDTAICEMSRRSVLTTCWLSCPPSSPRNFSTSNFSFCISLLPDCVSRNNFFKEYWWTMHRGRKFGPWFLNWKMSSHMSYNIIDFFFPKCLWATKTVPGNSKLSTQQDYNWKYRYLGQRVFPLECIFFKNESRHAASASGFAVKIHLGNKVKNVLMCILY